MNVPEWVPWLVAASVVAAWRHFVLGWFRAGRLRLRSAAAIYAAVIPVLVFVAFTLGERMGGVAVMLAVSGFAMSYVFALLSFPRIAFRERPRG